MEENVSYVMVINVEILEMSFFVSPFASFLLKYKSAVLVVKREIARGEIFNCEL